MKFAFLSKFGLECLTEPHEWNEETQQTIGQFISWEETYNFIPNVRSTEIDMKGGNNRPALSRT